jgi:hypothetical protein
MQAGEPRVYRFTRCGWLAVIGGAFLDVVLAPVR